MRQAVFGHLNLPAQADALLNPGITWFGWHVPVGVELGLVSLMGVVLLGVAIAQFRRAE
jgi:ABC-2 type transport system permease protein